jgi:pilus assembly protein Flp/PilA
MARSRRKVIGSQPDKGATSVEYGLMAALIAVVIVAAVTALGTAVSTLFEGAAGMF